MRPRPEKVKEKKFDNTEPVIYHNTINSAILPGGGMLFIIVEALIYITFIVLDLADFSPDISDIVKYLGVITAFVHALIMCVKFRGTRRILITAALFFTALADIFLLFFPDRYIPGLASFCVVQTIYTIMTTKRSETIKRFLIPCAIALIGICVAFISGFLSSDPRMFFLMIMLPYYAVLFALNTVRSWKIFHRSGSREDFIFALGLTLFILCDINVLIRNLNGFFPQLVPQSFTSAAIFLTWIFYLPSQVLISLLSEQGNTRLYHSFRNVKNSNT